jgi:WD40 repeat protein
VTNREPDGRTLASASNDGTVKLWHLVTGREVYGFTLPFTCYELICHRTFAPIGIVAFLPNSRARVEFCSRIAALGS